MIRLLEKIKILYYKLPFTGWVKITLEESENFSKRDIIILKENVIKASDFLYNDLERVLGKASTKYVFDRFFKGCNKTSFEERKVDFFINMAISNKLEEVK